MPSPRCDQTVATWDVVIVGGGPAGAATAITLANNGQRVLLVEKRAFARFKIGESLPPTSIALVKHFLGDLGDPEKVLPGLSRTVGNVSVWATEQVDTSNFFFTVAGSGLCIDRLAFDEALRSKAVAAGAKLLKGFAFKSCSRIDDHGFNWQLTLTSGALTYPHRSRYLVDCSGRNAVVATALGIERICDDRLFAYAQWYSLAGDGDGDGDRFTRLEAAPFGWWYSNRLPGTDNGEAGRLVVLHTDKDLPEAKQAASLEGFSRLLADSTHIAPLLEAKCYQPHGTIRGAPACSQRLQNFTGDGWMAVGDAAQAYDPLSSQGIDKALKTASHAGYMIHYALTDCEQGAATLDKNNPFIHRYEDKQCELWDTYVSQRDYYYGTQSRWSDQPFWRRRHPTV